MKSDILTSVHTCRISKVFLIVCSNYVWRNVRKTKKKLNTTTTKYKRPELN